jgi:hypothetical protein
LGRSHNNLQNLEIAPAVSRTDALKDLSPFYFPSRNFTMHQDKLQRTGKPDGTFGRISTAEMRYWLAWFLGLRVHCGIAIPNKDPIFAIFNANFVWITSFTPAFFFCSLAL